jgi:hypothetical protein
MIHALLACDNDFMATAKFEPARHGDGFDAATTAA